MISFVKSIVRKLGYDLTPRVPPDADSAEREVLRRVLPFTMTGPERVLAMVRAVRHVSRAGLPGALLECGVWRGGSMMAAALALRDAGDTARDLFLLDTYEGMTEPAKQDVNLHGIAADGDFRQNARAGGSDWCYAPLEEVRANLLSTGYSAERIHFVRGLVEDTVPAQAPPQLALLRLDTDWYASTRHGMEHLYPRLVPGGILILDDYGHWSGCRQAVDEYFAAAGETPFLNRIDYTGRLLVKP